ncbi:MAG: hypothetical protein FJ294_02555, partial [Planctomycetes bacterium]|nr:hypothetical protein [Planctomycetota bacterium]
GILLPTVGAFADDETGLADDLQNFTDEFDRIDALVQNATVTQGDLDLLAAALGALDGRQLTADAGVGLAISMPSDKFAWSLHLLSYVDVTTFADIDPLDLAAIQAALGATELPTLLSAGRGLGLATTEVGFSMAREFDFSGKKLAIGVTPKYQRVDSINYGINIDSYDDDNFDADEYMQDDGNFNLDVGASFEPGGGFLFGLMLRNALSYEYDSVVTLGESFTYKVGPVATAGVSWTNDWFTLAADVDLNARERVDEGAAGIGGLGISDDTQMWHVGGEFDLAHWFQLRAGYRGDFENTLEDALTAGFGLSPWDVFHIEVAGIYVDEDSLGVVAQLSFTF